MWKRERKGWVWVEEKAARKAADRPHWLAIAAGFLSPSVAAVALVISLNSLETSQQSMKVGQRAYLSIAIGKLRVIPFNPPDMYVTASFDIHNLGNTPARILSIEFRVETPPGWKAQSLAHDPNVRKIPSSVEAKTARPYFQLLSYKLDAEADAAVMRLGRRFGEGRRGIKVTGHIKYEDIFNETHSAQWCWLESSYSQFPDDC